jgi:superfamily II DNA or RNA helicase
MISELLDGISTTPLSLSEAIVRKILPSPIYISAMYNLDKEIDKKIKLMKKYNIATEDRKKYLEELNIYKSLYEKESKAEQIIKKHLPKEDNLKFIVFCENNKHLKEIQTNRHYLSVQYYL